MPMLKSRTDRGLIVWKQGGSRGPQTVNETITLGVGAGLALVAHVQAAASVALGVAASTGTPVAGDVSTGSVTLGVQLGMAALGDRNTLPQPITLAVLLGVDFTDFIHFGSVHRGNSAVRVTPKGTGKATVR